MNQTALRIDDIGACSKYYNRRGQVWWKVGGRYLPLSPFANWLFFKRMKPFKRWGVYRELTATDWDGIYSLLRKYQAKITAGVTATWVENDGSLTPLSEKYPDEASRLKEGVEEGLVEIAHHGLTHCIVKDNLYKPRSFSSNRYYHREFREWLPEEVIKRHIFEAMDILTSYFKVDIVTFMPPGNVWCEAAEKYAFQAGMRFLSSNEAESPTGKESNGLVYIGNKYLIAFHDKEIVEHGVSWLERQILEVKGGDKAFCFVKDIGYALKDRSNREDEKDK